MFAIEQTKFKNLCAESQLLRGMKANSEKIVWHSNIMQKYVYICWNSLREKLEVKAVVLIYLFALQDSDILNLGTGSVSWFEVNGYGCKPTYPINITSEDPYRPIRPDRVDGCFLDYPVIEILQSGVQSFLAVSCFSFS